MLKWILILSISLIPPIVYSIYIRNIEKWKREPWSYVILAFIWGGVAAIIFLGISYLIFGQVSREHEYFQSFRSIYNVFIIVILFPFLGAFFKSVGLRLVRKELDEVEDGLIHGAILGLGFGGFVNIAYLYFTFTWETELIAGYEVPTLAFLAIASISTILLHGSSTAATGYGVSSIYVEKDYSHMILYFMSGVLIHALFNLLNVTTIYLELQSGFYYLIGLVGIMIISNLVFRTIRARLLKLIEILDKETHLERVS